MQGGIGFILIGGFFVYALLKALWVVITRDWDKEEFSAKSVLKIFGATLFALLLLIIFMIYVLPHLDK